MDGMTAGLDVSRLRNLEFMRRVMGEQLLALLFDPTVTDILLNPPLDGEPEGRLWVERLGCDMEWVGTMSARSAEDFIVGVAATLDTVANKRSCVVEGKLPLDGSRFEGIIPPVVDAPCFAIRRRASVVFPLSDYVAKGTMTARQKEIIEDGVVNRLNILAVGGTGSGKTTLLNAIILAISDLTPHHRVLVAEEVPELRCAAQNVVPMVSDEAHPLSKLIRTAMRMRPDRILVGEVRGAEALDMLQAWNTGHPGGAASAHCNTSTPDAALTRLADLVSMASNAPRYPERMIGEAVDLIVCVERSHEGVRRVTQIVRVEGFDTAKRAYTLNTIKD